MDLSKEPPTGRGALLSGALAAILKKAISKVDGVNKVDVSCEKRQAAVTFDDAKASLQKLTQATENAGWPSTVKR
jgi:mercuric ion binding protein